MKALVFDRTGEAAEVLSWRDVPEPVAGPGEVLLRPEACPIHPSDLFFIRGGYRWRPKLPQIAGLSGAGRIVQTGAGVDLRPGERVAFRSPGAWAELVTVPVERTIAAPDDIAVEDAAQFPLNPLTAWGLLDMADVKPPAWVGLTAPSSSVARLVDALAARRGLRTIGIHARSEDLPSLGERVRAETGGAGLGALIDSVGGPIVSQLLPVLVPGATMVAYGAISSEPALVTNAAMVYANLTWKGFGIDRWLSGLQPGERDAMFSELWQAIREGKLPLPVRARIPMSEFGRALDASKDSRGEKILLV
jgi:NADPH:quinone reductase-like Zn-dependent oxidoreductase